MYIVISQTSIEFYYKEDTILEIAERDSAYKAKRVVSEGGDLIDLANYTKDENDFGYDAIKMAFSDLFVMLEKVMKTGSNAAYFHSLTSGHSTTEYYSGFKVVDYEKASVSLLEMIDNLFTMGAAYKVLMDWYLLTPLEGLSKYYASMYDKVRKDLLKLTFNLRKEDPGNIISLLTSNIKSDTVTMTIPAGVLTPVPHAINSADYSIDIYDSNGKEISEGIIQTRAIGQFEVYSNVILTDTTFNIIGRG